MTLYQRHTKNCVHKNTGRTLQNCHCTIWVQMVLEGKPIRESLKTSNRKRAEKIVAEWISRGTQEDRSIKSASIREAEEKFLQIKRLARQARSTIEAYESLFSEINAYAEDAGFRMVSEIDLDFVLGVADIWEEKEHAQTTVRLRMKVFRAFLKFCIAQNWIQKNSASDLKLPPEDLMPTLPYEREQIIRMLAAVSRWRNKKTRVRMLALVLLLRWSGLRIQDAATLSKDRIVNGSLIIKTMKTKVDVTLPLPPVVIEALDAIPAERYFFWTGQGTKKCCASNWRTRLHGLAKLAGVPNDRPHRFRDTFAVEALLANVPLERVSQLLGHKSVKVTEKHYLAFVEARRKQLEDDVRKSWAYDSLAQSTLGELMMDLVSEKGTVQ